MEKVKVKVDGWRAELAGRCILSFQSRELEAIYDAQTACFNRLPESVREGVLSRGDGATNKFIKQIDYEAQGWRVRAICLVHEPELERLRKIEQWISLNRELIVDEVFLQGETKELDALLKDSHEKAK